MSLATLYKIIVLIRSLGEILELEFQVRNIQYDGNEQYDGNKPYSNPYTILIHRDYFPAA